MNVWLPPLLAAALGAGLLNLIDKLIRSMVARHRASQPQAIQAQRVHDAVAAADESIAVVARARDELEEDNRRLREQGTADRQRYDKDLNFLRFRVSELEAEGKAMRQEFNNLESQLRQALGELQGLKARYDIK